MDLEIEFYLQQLFMISDLIGALYWIFDSSSASTVAPQRTGAIAGKTSLALVERMGRGTTYRNSPSQRPSIKSLEATTNKIDSLPEVSKVFDVFEETRKPLAKEKRESSERIYQGLYSSA